MLYAIAVLFQLLFVALMLKNGQYSDIMRFLVRHNRHHKVSQSVPLFMSRKSGKTVTIF